MVWPKARRLLFYSVELCSLLWHMWAFETWPRRNILRMLKLQIRGEAGMCLLAFLRHLWDTELRFSFTPLSLSMSLFALACTLSHAVMDLSEGEDDKSHNVMVPAFPLCKPRYYDSLGFCPGFQRKWVCINIASACNLWFICFSVSSADFWTHWPFLAWLGQSLELSKIPSSY